MRCLTLKVRCSRPRFARLIASLLLVSSLAKSGPAASAELVGRATQSLVLSMHQEVGWLRVHAAEALIAEGETNRVRSYLEGLNSAELAQWPRIGLWRVRLALAQDQAERDRWTNQIVAVFMDGSKSPDRMQALETLCKTGYRAEDGVRSEVKNLRRSGAEADRVLASWALVLADESGAEITLVRGLDSADSVTRQRTAYALRWLHFTDPATRNKLSAAAAREGKDSSARPYLVAAAFIAEADASSLSKWRTELRNWAEKGEPNSSFEACQILRFSAGPEEVTALTPLFGAGGDRGIGAAWLVLHASR